MNKSAQAGLVIGAIVVILIVGAFFVFSGDDSDTNPTQEVPDSNVDETEVIDLGEEEPMDDEPEEEPMDDEEPEETMMDNIIEFTSSGYSPNSITISQGETITFINKDPTKKTWPASDVHPSHTSYPDSSISKCGTSPETIFDACNGLAEDEMYEFTFNEVGEWDYHDHLSAGKKGTITVE